MNLVRAELLLMLAEEAQLAYDDEPPSMGIQLRDSFGPRGFIALTDYGSVISIRGTKSWADLKADSAIFMGIFLERYAVHGGFLGRFLQIWDQIVRCNLSHPIYVTGHSLGGALATLVGMALKDKCGLESEVVTFGSPRVGDHAFAQDFNRFVPKSTRVVNTLDVVPRMPKLDYWHVDNLLHINLEGKILNPVHSWIRGLFEIGEVAISDADGEALSNHHVSSYVGALTQLVNRKRGKEKQS